MRRRELHELCPPAELIAFRDRINRKPPDAPLALLRGNYQRRSANLRRDIRESSRVEVGHRDCSACRETPRPSAHPFILSAFSPFRSQGPAVAPVPRVRLYRNKQTNRALAFPQRVEICMRAIQRGSRVPIDEPSNRKTARLSRAREARYY